MSKVLRYIISLLFFITISFSKVIAQTDDYHIPQKINIKPIQKGDILVDVFYGGPYLLGMITKIVYEDSLKTQPLKYDVSNFHNYNQFGAKLQYMLNDKIDIGIEYTHALVTFDYLGKASKYYTLGIRKQRVLGKINIHFATSTKVDPYLTLGAGFNSTTLYTTESGKSSIDLQNSSIFLLQFLLE